MPGISLTTYGILSPGIFPPLTWSLQALDFNGGIEVPVHRFMVLKLRHVLIQIDGRGGDAIVLEVCIAVETYGKLIIFQLVGCKCDHLRPRHLFGNPLE